MEIKTPTILGDLSFRLGGLRMPVTVYNSTPVAMADTIWGVFKTGINNTAQAITLPDPAVAVGKLLIFKVSVSIGSGTVTLSQHGSETIDGATTFAMDAQYEAVTIVSDGTNWHIVSKITV